MSDIAKFGRRAFNFGSQPDTDKKQLNSNQNLVKSIVAIHDNDSESNLIIEETIPHEQAQTSSKHRAISAAISGRARQRGFDKTGTGWGNVRKLENSPIKKKHAIIQNDSDEKIELDMIESALEEEAEENMQVDSSTCSMAGFGNSLSRTDHAYTSPAVQALLALQEPDCATVPDTSYSIYFNSALMNSGIFDQLEDNQSSTSNVNSDLELLASACLISPDLVMQELDEVWNWNTLITEVAPFLSIPK